MDFFSEKLEITILCLLFYNAYVGNTLEIAFVELE